ncbi:MAG: signal peptidase II [Lachnospiraceae bacterium]|nr:signal peptidase II [Lachnospiraceae bacterium]
MEQNKIRLRPLISAIIIFALVLLDQLSKYFAYEKLSDTPMGVSVINGVFSLYYVENTGISFSLLDNKMTLIIIITLVISLLLIYVLIKTPKLKYYMPLTVTLSVVIAGAIGNLIDRIFRGYVIDFIKPDFVNFAIFNVADIYVCVGLFVLIILILFKYKDKDFDYIFKKGK